MQGLKKFTVLVCTAAVICASGLFAGPGVSAALPIVERTVAIGRSHELAVKSEGTLWSWNSLTYEYSNINGQLGDGSTTSRYEPAKNLDDVVSVYTNEFHSMAIKSDGSLWEWGEYEGTMGFPPEPGRFNSPAKILDDVVDMMDYIGSDDVGLSLALKSDGSLWVWGEIGYPALRSGRFVPYEAMTDVVKMADNAILKSDGTFWHIKAKFDYYTEKLEYDFIQVCDDVVSFVPDANLILKKDNSLWNWRLDNESGYVLNKLLEDVVYATENNVALTKDGSLYTWGYNVFSKGQSGPDTPQKVFNNVTSIQSLPAGSTITANLKNGTQMTWGFHDSLMGAWSGVVLVNSTDMRFNDIYITVQAESESTGSGILIQKELAKLRYDNTLGFNYHNHITNEDISVYTMNVNDVVDWISRGSDHLILKNDGSLLNVKGDKIMDGVKVTAKSVPSVPSLVANTIASAVLVNGKRVAFDAYNIEGNNYFKLRDLAYILKGTEKQFEVGWDGATNAISLTSGKPYTVVGGEMTGKGGGARTPTPTDSKILLNGQEVSFTAYKIEGNNYFKLRDIGAAFDFGVDWDGEHNTIVIDTSKGYAIE